MPRVCQVSGKGTRVGKTICRRGLAKSKGGIGRKRTGVNKRKFKVNLQRKRVWVPELGRHVRVRLAASALKSMSVKGPYRVLLDAGIVKPIQAKKK